MRDHDTFWLAGASRGVNHVGEVIRLTARGNASGWKFPLCSLASVLIKPDFTSASFQNVLLPGWRILGIDRHISRAALDNPKDIANGVDRSRSNDPNQL